MKNYNLSRKSPSAITPKCDFQWLGKRFILSYTMRNMIITVLLVLGMGLVIAFAQQEISPSQPSEEKIVSQTNPAAASSEEQEHLAELFKVSPPVPKLEAS